MSAVDPTVVEPTTTADMTAADSRSARREKLRLFFRNPSGLIGIAILGFWVICAIFGEQIAPYSPYATDFEGHLPPGPEHLFGTDKLGRDVFSRVIVGARDVLIAAPIAAVLGTAAGTALGLIMGYYRSWVDDVLSRIVEGFLALPVSLVALLALASLGATTTNVIIVVGVFFTPIVARTVRAAVLAERENDYVQAAKLRGENGLYIMTREIFPNITGPVVVEFTVRIGYAIFTIAFLSFLGVGLQPPSPDWGLMVSEEYQLIIGGYWWVTVFPAAAIATLVISVNLIADALQETFER